MSDTATQAPDVDTTSILGRIEKTIGDAQASGSIADQVVQVFADREIKSRADRLVQGFDLLAKLTDTLKGVDKPDQKFFTDTGPNTSPTLSYSEKRRGEIAKAKKTVDKATQAINAALTKADFGALDKLLKSGGKDED